MKKNEKQHSAVASFLLHLHPKKVNEQALNYTRTFGLGGMNALLFVVLAFTGLLLRFSYVPTPENAYDSIVAMQVGSLYGRLLRNVHHWSAMLMIITSFLHLMRVFYSQSIFYERQKNWYYGLVLFMIVLAFNFTGYLMPWDQLSFWAVSIMTNIVEYIPLIGVGLADLLRGGSSVNGQTLLNFYNFHTALFPLIFIVFMVIHFWLIRKAKGVTVANAEDNKMVDVNPELIYKELLVGLVLLVVILLFSLFMDAPLLDKANPGISPNPSKAPWYFMGFQELLINLHPIMVSVVIPMGLIAYFIFIPKLKIEPSKIGTWFYSPKGKSIVISSVVFAAILTFGLILILEYTSHFNGLGLDVFISTGILPLLMYLIPSAGFMLYLWKVKKADRMEICLSITTFIFTSYLLMSFVGIWLRGEGMHLIF